MSGHNWNAPVSLISKPKGARKQAADARLEQYKKVILSTLNPDYSSAACGLQPIHGLPLSSTKVRSGRSSTAARRARLQKEMAMAAGELMNGSKPAAVPFAAPPAAALAASSTGLGAGLSLNLANLQAQVKALSQQLALAAGRDSTSATAPVKGEDERSSSPSSDPPLSATTVGTPSAEPTLGAWPSNAELSKLRLLQLAELNKLQQLQCLQALHRSVTTRTEPSLPLHMQLQTALWQLQHSQMAASKHPSHSEAAAALLQLAPCR
ncbi:hypothetical protein AB1Y20_022456 [Prymnesium parvum]|uniref:Uncharacterized protein n=1 Tax=Prymnesium parvum TaxID=97485 RepID=A0AB34JGZ2_PRYPA